jgi:hypothetical protein
MISTLLIQTRVQSSVSFARIGHIDRIESTLRTIGGYGLTTLRDMMASDDLLMHPLVGTLHCRTLDFGSRTARRITPPGRPVFAAMPPV